MADFEIVWEGLEAFNRAIERISEQADEAAKEIVSKSAAEVEKAIKDNFSGSHKKGEPHVGGSKPNVVTGTLRRSVHADPVIRVGLGEYATHVGPRTVYARRVELGYRGSTGHPYTTPGYITVRPKLTAIQAEVARKFLTA